MQMECEEGYHHTTKEFALPLLCGDYLVDYTDAKINLLNTCGSNNQLYSFIIPFRAMAVILFWMAVPILVPF